MNLSRVDIEMTFIRSLACSGVILSGTQLSPEDRRERIRIAIMKTHMNNKPLPTDPTLTYAQAFQLAYNRPCELRQAERDRFNREVAFSPVPAANFDMNIDDGDERDDLSTEVR
jgi:hypothetical protein